MCLDLATNYIMQDGTSRQKQEELEDVTTFAEITDLRRANYEWKKKRRNFFITH